MIEEAERRAVTKTVGRIDKAWIDGRFEDLRELIDPDIVLATPGFSVRIRGAEK